MIQVTVYVTVLIATVGIVVKVSYNYNWTITEGGVPLYSNLEFNIIVKKFCMLSWKYM